MLRRKQALKEQTEMDGAELDKLSLSEYIQHIQKLSWEEFIAEAFRKSGTFYVSALYGKAVEAKAKTIVEIGVMIGQSTRALLKAAVENKGHLYSVELSNDSLSLVGEALKSGGMDTSFWTAICGDDLEVAKAWTVPIEFLLIDTSHEYEFTKKELEAYFKFVVQQGIIVLHDSYYPPVKQAIDDWMKLHGEWMFDDITPVGDGWGLGLLRRKQS